MPHTRPCLRPSGLARRLRRALPLLTMAGLLPWSSAALAAECSTSTLYNLIPSRQEEAAVMMLGHVDSGTRVDSGRYLAQLVVDEGMQAIVASSVAAGCSQVFHHAAGGTIVLSGIAAGSFDAKSQLKLVRVATGGSENMLPTWREHRDGSTLGAEIYPHEGALKPRQMRRLTAGDVIQMTGKADAQATIVGGTFLDQASITYSWNGPAPYIEVFLP